MTPDKLVKELDKAVQVPGLTNIWVPPIRNRIDMLATGVKSPIGIKISANDLQDIDRVAQQIEQVAKKVPGVSSALAERLTGGRYVDMDINRKQAARYGLDGVFVDHKTFKKLSMKKAIENLFLLVQPTMSSLGTENYLSKLEEISNTYSSKILYSFNCKIY